jgi:hypothetical protein
MIVASRGRSIRRRVSNAGMRSVHRVILRSRDARLHRLVSLLQVEVVRKIVHVWAWSRCLGFIVPSLIGVHAIHHRTLVCSIGGQGVIWGLGEHVVRGGCLSLASLDLEIAVGVVSIGT